MYTRDQLKKLVQFILKSFINSTQYLTFYAAHHCKCDTSTNCTDNSTSKAAIVLLLSSWSVLKMTNISPYKI